MYFLAWQFIIELIKFDLKCGIDLVAWKIDKSRAQSVFHLRPNSGFSHSEWEMEVWDQREFDTKLNF